MPISGIHVTHVCLVSGQVWGTDNISLGTKVQVSFRMNRYIGMPESWNSAASSAPGNKARTSASVSVL